jgi:hypothetical protein
MENNTSWTFLNFAWETLTEQQQFRISMYYEIKTTMDSKSCETKKRFVYRAIAAKYCYTMKQIERIANGKIKEPLAGKPNFRPLGNENN